MVGFFICKSEHSLGQATIQEALQIFKDWNKDYSPQYTMTDCDQAELNALRAVYPDIQTFLCDFHVKKAWKERLRNLFKDPTLNLGTYNFQNIILYDIPFNISMFFLSSVIRYLFLDEY